MLYSSAIACRVSSCPVRRRCSEPFGDMVLVDVDLATVMLQTFGSVTTRKKVGVLSSVALRILRRASLRSEDFPYSTTRGGRERRSAACVAIRMMILSRHGRHRRQLLAHDLPVRSHDPVWRLRCGSRRGDDGCRRRGHPQGIGSAPTTRRERSSSNHPASLEDASGPKAVRTDVITGLPDHVADVVAEGPSEEARQMALQFDGRTRGEALHHHGFPQIALMSARPSG